MIYVKCYEDFSNQEIYGPEQKEMLHKMCSILQDVFSQFGFIFYIDDSKYKYYNNGKRTLISYTSDGNIDSIGVQTRLIINKSSDRKSFLLTLIGDLFNFEDFDWIELNNFPNYKFFFLNQNRSNTSDLCYINVTNINDGFKKIIGKMITNFKKPDTDGMLLTKSSPIKYKRILIPGFGDFIIQFLTLIYKNTDLIIKSTNIQELINSYIAKSAPYLSYNTINNIDKNNNPLSDQMRKNLGDGYDTAVDMGSVGF